MLVIGNGESRVGIDIDAIDDLKIGCNAIYRDFKVDHLVCVDRRMVTEAFEQGANEHALVYTREDWANKYKEHKGTRTLPLLPYTGSDRWDKPLQWGSGPYAVLLGAKLSQDVSLLGFDLHSNTNNVNNIYKGTPNYDAKDKRAVDPRYWIHQIGKVFEIYRKRNFIIYQTDSWQLPTAWKYPNVTLDNISNI